MVSSEAPTAAARSTAAPAHRPGGALEGRTLAAGAETQRLLGTLLGLDDPVLGLTVSAAAWKDHAIEAAVDWGGPEPVVFRFERQSEDAQGMLRTGTLVVYFRGPNLPERVIQAIFDSAPRRLAGLTLEDLADRIAADPEIGRPGLAMPPGVDEKERPRSLLDTWGGADAYADFFAGGEVARSQLDSLDAVNFFAFVQHSDAECVHVNPHCSAPIVWLVNYPWEDRAGTARARSQSQQVGPEALDQMLTTDLNEQDVVLGNPDKIERVLAAAVKQHERHGKTVFFSNTCVPVVTGEDVESRVNRVRCQTGCPLLYLTVTPRSMVNVFHDILVERRLAAERATPVREPASINLIGYARTRALEEVLPLLEACGVHVNCVLLPELTPDTIDRMPRATLNVLLPNQLWQHLYEQVQFSSVLPAISPQAPFGISGTRRWVGEIVRALGLPTDVDAVFAAHLASRREAWERASAAVAGHRIGLVVRGDETYYLTRPAATWGVPIVELLEELGFGLDVLLKVDDRQAASRAAREVHALFREPARHTVKGFNSLELLLRRLRESQAEAFLTYHFFDWRVTQAGKNLFSLQAFELGVDGAVRTAERLVHRCSTPFYRRYAAYLQRTPSGLRTAPVLGDSPR